MKYKQYSKYKDSGVEWIGEIPEGWEVKKLKFVSSVFGRIGFRGYTINDIVDQGEGAITLSPSNIIDDKFDLKKKTYLSWMKYEESPEIHVFENDILLCTTSSVGKNCIVPKQSEKMTINPQLVVLKPFNISSKFLSFFMNCNKYKDQINSTVEGSTLKTISQQKLLNHYILFPPSDQQIHISDFLDKQTTQFDELIAKSKKQITLSEEKRQATINQAVTKGLDPSVKMKDSGVEWIGDIPEHWEITSVKHTYKIQLGKMLQSTSRSNDEKLVPYIKALHVKWDDVEIQNLPKMWANKKDIDQYGIFSGDLLVSEGGYAGRSGILNHKIDTCIIQNALHRVRAKNSHTVNFLWYVLRCCYDSNWIEVLCNKATIRHFTREKFAELKIPLPPSSEALQIIEFLDKQTTKFDDLIAKSKTQITLLEEKKQALITAAVTGKIDVRGEIAV